MRMPWIVLGALALVASGMLAGRSLAGDEPKESEGTRQEAPIDGYALVKALTANAWDTKGTGMWESVGKVTFRLGAGKTLLVQDYAATGTAGESLHGLSVIKWSADGKTASAWWFDETMKAPLELKGPASDTGYELKGEMALPDGKPSTATFKLVKKGAGFEFTLAADGQVMMTEVYTKAR